jgi:hypothetical protein
MSDFIPYQAMQLREPGILEVFDMSFVDPTPCTLAVAASKDSRGPFGMVVIVDTDLNLVTKELIPDPPFANACSLPAPTGPNGVFVSLGGRWPGSDGCRDSAYFQRKEGYSPEPSSGRYCHAEFG